MDNVIQVVGAEYIAQVVTNNGVNFKMVESFWSKNIEYCF